MREVEKRKGEGKKGEGERDGGVQGGFEGVLEAEGVPEAGRRREEAETGGARRREAAAILADPCRATAEVPRAGGVAEAAPRADPGCLRADDAVVRLLRGDRRRVRWRRRGRVRAAAA